MEKGYNPEKSGLIQYTEDDEIIAEGESESRSRLSMGDRIFHPIKSNQRHRGGGIKLLPSSHSATSRVEHPPPPSPCVEGSKPD